MTYLKRTKNQCVLSGEGAVKVNEGDCLVWFFNPQLLFIENAQVILEQTYKLDSI